MDKILGTLITVGVGVAAAGVLYYVLNKIAEILPGRWETRVKPYLFSGPALLLVGLYIVAPLLETVNYSFANADGTALVGLDNYTKLLESSDFRNTLFNTLLWVVCAPVLSIVLGLIVATMTDRLSPRAEKSAKTIIFLPLAIGAVGAATIWRFVYATVPQGEPQIGIQNALWTTLGGDPVNWLQTQKLHFNTFEIMVIFLWAQVGFSMMLLSSAIKGVPADTIEAARVDGARELQIFWRVLVPQIRLTIITVFITVLVWVLKIFDLIFVMTNGAFNTNVIGVEFYNQLFTNQDQGRAAAIVVMLIIAVTPVMIYQVRHFRAQESGR